MILSGELGYGNTVAIGTTNGSMANCVDLDLGSDIDSVSAISVGAGYFTCILTSNHLVKVQYFFFLMEITMNSKFDVLGLCLSMQCWGMVSDSM